jgi:hypothetical protein
LFLVAPLIVNLEKLVMRLMCIHLGRLKSQHQLKLGNPCPVETPELPGSPFFSKNLIAVPFAEQISSYILPPLAMCVML